MNTFFQRPDRIHTPLHVVTPIINSPRYRTRWKHAEDYIKMVTEHGARLHLVEVRFGERDWSIPDAPLGCDGRPLYEVIRLSTTDEFWFKEPIINIGVSRLPQDWRYVAWIDADVAFARDDWANETLHLLQHYAVIQMWSQYQDLTPNHEILGMRPSFMANYVREGQVICRGPYDYDKRYPGAPGLAWACTREAWDTFGGLLDVCILGAGDWYMAHGLVGSVKPNLENHPAYVDAIMTWQQRALALRKNVGVMDGLVLHRWHGPKVHRQYGTREQILIETQYNPTKDVCRDWQLLPQFSPMASIELRDRIRRYLHARNEDA